MIDWAALEEAYWTLRFYAGDREAREYVDKTLEAAGFVFLGEGYYRMGWLSPSRRTVVKIETGWYITCNYRECYRGKRRIPAARARRLTESYWAIVATRVGRADKYHYRDLQNEAGRKKDGVVHGPWWEAEDTPYYHASSDWCQHGILPNGKIVLYDAGSEFENEVPDRVRTPSLKAAA